MKKVLISILSLMLVMAMLLPSCAGDKPVVSDTSSGSAAAGDDSESGTSDDGPDYDPSLYPVEDLTGKEDTTTCYTISGGYDGGLRVKSSGELLFSPYIPELLQTLRISGLEAPTALYAMIGFTLLDENNHGYHAYDPVRVNFGASKGDFFDLWLQSADYDCGFCPTAGRTYNITMDVFFTEDTTVQSSWWDFYDLALEDIALEDIAWNVRTGPIDAPQAGKSYKKDEILCRCEMKLVKANDDYAASAFYKPTEIPATPSVKDQLVLTYRAAEGGKLEGITRQGVAYNGNGSAMVTAIPDEGYIFTGWSDGVATAYRFGDKPTEDTEYVATFMESQITPGVATMIINTEFGMPIWDTSTYQTATMTIVGASKDKYNTTSSLQIRGRGNSSFNGGANPDYDYDSKNSYRLKLDEKQQLLGIGNSKNRDWVLNSNKFDASNLHNYAIWQLARRMGTIGYVPECTWVQLYLNGDYRGIYMLTEFIETGTDRVEVEGLDNTEDPGFLLELDFRGKTGMKDVDYFQIENFDNKRAIASTPFVVKNADRTKATTAKIKAFVQQCNDAIKSKDQTKIAELIDLPSFVDMIIIEELAQDCDFGGASMFFSRNSGGKLCFTAPWDFDFGFGTYGPATDVYDLSVGTEYENVWANTLLECEWFRQLLLSRMDELKANGVIEDVIGSLQVQGILLTPAADRNDKRWSIYGNNYHVYVSYLVSGRLFSYADHIRMLTGWFRVRYDVMYDCFKDFKKYKGKTPDRVKGSYNEAELIEWVYTNRDTRVIPE